MRETEGFSKTPCSYPWGIFVPGTQSLGSTLCPLVNWLPRGDVTVRESPYAHKRLLAEIERGLENPCVFRVRREKKVSREGVQSNPPKNIIKGWPRTLKTNAYYCLRAGRLSATSGYFEYVSRHSILCVDMLRHQVSRSALSVLGASF